MDIFSASNRGPRVQVLFPGKSRTKQSFGEESEINNIMARYTKTGIIDHLSTFGGDYGFASSIVFHEAMNVVTKADQMFEALPASVRRRFNGDPGDFLEFVQNPENQEELIELGLAKRIKGVQPEVAVAESEAQAAPIAPEVVPDAGVGDPSPAGPEVPDTVVT